MDYRFFFVVNSRIGHSAIQQVSNAISQSIAAENYVIHLTEYAGHAGILTKQALSEGYKIVVAVGGDGTVNEVVQELATKDVCLGIIPQGSGNGLARHCHIPLNCEKAIRILIEGHTANVDLGKVNDIFFVSNAGVGFDALVCHHIRQTKSRGLAMYVRHVIKQYLSYRPLSYTVRVNGQTLQSKAFFLNVANGSEFGYGFQIAPQASIQDGMMDLILVKKINLWTGFRFVLDGWRKRLSTNPNCIYMKAKELTIESEQLSFFQTDGDAHACSGQCHFQLLESALPILIPTHIKQL